MKISTTKAKPTTALVCGKKQHEAGESLEDALGKKTITYE